MAIPSILTQVGPLAHDTLWTAYASWEGIRDLLKDPYAWVSTLVENGVSIHAELPRKTEITTIFLYPPTSHSPIDLVSDVIVQAKNISDIVLVQALRPSDGTSTISLDNWILPSSRLIRIGHEDIHLAGGATLEMADNRTITIPSGGQLAVTLRYNEDLGKVPVGYVHFPVWADKTGDFFAEIAQSPQGLILGLKEYATLYGSNPEKYNAQLVGKAEEEGKPVSVQFIDLLDPDLMSRVRVIHQYGSMPNYTCCCVISGDVECIDDDTYRFYTNTIEALLYFQPAHGDEDVSTIDETLLSNERTALCE